MINSDFSTTTPVYRYIPVYILKNIYSCSYQFIHTLVYYMASQLFKFITSMATNISLTCKWAISIYATNPSRC